ncbi:hypothetical protein ACIODT_03170 [Streptomyces sp. NPDC088251]
MVGDPSLSGHRPGFSPITPDRPGEPVRADWTDWPARIGRRRNVLNSLET